MNELKRYVILDAQWNEIYSTLAISAADAMFNARLSVCPPPWPRTAILADLNDWKPSESSSQLKQKSNEH